MAPKRRPGERLAADGGRSWRRADFERSARDALAHLYDVVYLQTHPLAALALARTEPPSTGAGQALRQALVETIEALRPPAEPIGAEAWRGYQILTMHHVEGLSVGEVLAALSISRSTYYRESQRAVQAVLSLLWARWSLRETAEPATGVAPAADNVRVLVRPEPALHLVAPVRPAERAAPSTPANARHNLPLQVTSFVGRGRELAAVAEALHATHLLTLTGAGGCGKTRLALQVAAGQAERFPDGVWLVDLAPLADPDLVAATAAAVLGVRGRPGQSMLPTLARALVERSMLVVLDNCEHLIEASARLADALIRGCPGVRVLTTSREPLGIAGEAVWPVPSLELPDGAARLDAATIARTEAVQLFAERARAARPAFAVTADNAEAVAQVCRRLDGIPLALELAAARLRALPVEQVAARLDDRFRLLTEGNRAALPRHRTLRAMIDWSHDLLAEDERVALRRLAVFAGGCSLEAAEAVCAGADIEQRRVLDLLTRLVDKSLVVADELAGGRLRCRLLETVRQYAAEKLAESGEAAAARDRHAAWCLALAERVEPDLATADQVAGLDQLDAEHDNLRAALAWSLDHDAEAGLRLAAALWPYWRMRTHFVEGRRWLDGLLVRTAEGAAVRAKALLGAGRLAFEMADRAGALARYRESLTVSRAIGEASLAAWALRELGQALTFLGDYDQAEQVLEEGLAIVRATDDRPGLGETLTLLGQVAEWRGDPRRALALSGEGLAALRMAGDRRRIAAALLRVGRATLATGDAARARALFEEGLALERALGSPAGMTRQLSHLGQVACWEGDAERAQPLIEASLSLAREHDDPLWITVGLLDLGRVAIVAGDRAGATASLRESLALSHQAGVRRLDGMILHGLGLAAWNAGDAAGAATWLRECLALQRELGDRLGIAQCLEGLAAAAAGTGRPERAARLLGAAEALRDAAGAPLPPAERPVHAVATRAVRLALGAAGLAAAWTVGRQLAVDAAAGLALDEAMSHDSPPRAGAGG